jgi:hypothetical protein
MCFQISRRRSEIDRCLSKVACLYRKSYRLLAVQIAIADILPGMDAEIVALDDKLAKARQIKQGMMQELLAGKIRLL